MASRKQAQKISKRAPQKLAKQAKSLKTTSKKAPKPAKAQGKKKEPAKSKSKTSAASVKAKSTKKPLAAAIQQSHVTKKYNSTNTQQSTQTGLIPDTSPTPAVLKSFRKIAEENRRLAKKIEKARAATTDFLAKPQKKGKTYTIDLRIHSPGSVGFFSTGGVDSAPALIRLAKAKGLELIALTDYYNPSHIDSFKVLAEKSGIVSIPGIDIRCEINNCSEVYFVALFPEHYTSELVAKVLQELEIPETASGREDYCLRIPFEKVLSTIESHHGVLIPTHLDKTPYRQLAIPALVEQYGIHTFDLVHPENTEFFRDRWPQGRFTFFSFSNAYALAQIGSRTAQVKLSNPGFEGIKEIVQRRV